MNLPLGTCGIVQLALYLKCLIMDHSCISLHANLCNRKEQGAPGVLAQAWTPYRTGALGTQAVILTRQKRS